MGRLILNGSRPGGGMKARLFEDVEDTHVDFNGTALPTGANADFSAFCWGYVPAAFSGVLRTFFSHYAGAGAGQFLLARNPGGTLNINLWGGSNHTTALAWPSDQWVHAGIVRSAGQIIGYVDGVAENLSVYPSALQGIDFQAGCYHSTVLGEARGCYIADLRTYDDALTPGEVALLAGGGAHADNLTHRWFLDTDDVLDKVGSLHGTSYDTSFATI